MSDAQAIRPAFKVGQTWLLRNGAVARIEEIRSANEYPILASTLGGPMYFRPDGSCCNSQHGQPYPYDLHALISGPPEQAQEGAPEPIDAEFPRPREIPEPIRTGAAPFYLVVASDDAGGKPGGNPIVWETYIPEGSDLRSVLQQQRRVGSRYGTTYVAECRIIPELTRDAD